MKCQAFVKSSNINISFIKPVYSKISSSPTKLAEVLAMGIPVISNSGVGDVEEIIQNSKGGMVIKDFVPDEYERVVISVPLFLQSDPSFTRNKVESEYSLKKGIQLYREVYDKILIWNSHAVNFI